MLSGGKESRHFLAHALNPARLTISSSSSDSFQGRPAEERVSEEEIRLVYLKQFELNTPYAAIIAFVKRLHITYEFTSGRLQD